MDESTTFTVAFVVIGLLLIAMTLGGSFLARLPLSAAMLYLAVGWGIGPAGIGLVDLDPFDDAKLLERVTEIAVLISLFTAGLKLEMPPLFPQIPMRSISSTLIKNGRRAASITSKRARRSKPSASGAISTSLPKAIISLSKSTEPKRSTYATPNFARAFSPYSIMDRAEPSNSAMSNCARLH